MLRPPKGLTLAVDDKRNWTVLYAGDDMDKALSHLTEQPKGATQIFVWKNGALFKTRETSESRSIRDTINEQNLKDALASQEKAVAAAASARKAEAEKKAAADKKAQEKARTEHLESERKRKLTAAENLSRAAERAKADAGK